MNKILTLFMFLTFFICLFSCKESPNWTLDQDNKMIGFKFNFQNVVYDSVEFQIGIKGIENKEFVRVNYWNDPTSILGLKENCIYNVTPTLFKDGSELVMDLKSIQMPDMNDSILTITTKNVSNFKFQKNILIRRFFRNGYHFIIDSDGDVIWYDSLGDDVMRAFHPVSNNSNIVDLRDSSRIVESNLYGDIVNEIKTSDTLKFHHEILKHDDKYVAIFYDKKVYDLSLVGGNKEDIVNTDGIIVFDTLGRVVFKWSVFDVINPIEIDNVLIAKKDLGHANAVMVDRDGNYMISLRDFNQIWKINSANGELMWKLGENGDFPLPDSLEFIGQHSVELNKYGGFDVFDNGNKQIRPESRIINFILDEENKLIKKSKLIPLSLDLTSYRMCSAYQIDLNHYLVCTTRKQLLVSVVDLDGNVVWQISGNQASYRAYPVDWFVNDSFHSSK